MVLDSLPTSRLFNLESTALATKKNAPANKQTADQPTVTRITASDTKPKKDAKKKSVASAAPEAEQTKKRVGNPLAAIGGYFKGAWFELRQVRWPNRRATWSLTMAVLAFTAVFAVLILLLDALFKYLFELMIG